MFWLLLLATSPAPPVLQTVRFIASAELAAAGPVRYIASAQLAPAGQDGGASHLVLLQQDETSSGQDELQNMVVWLHKGGKVDDR